jgi:hypothetical protein
MMVTWADLEAELARWRDAGEIATLWWRDDDAVSPTESLGRLLSIAPGVPVSLAVIPGAANSELAKWLADHRSAPRAEVTVLQHGWQHLNHSGDGKKSEFPAQRPMSQVSSDLSAGWARLGELFGTSAMPVLVPPWNRFDDRFLGLLARSGITGISRASPRRATRPTPGVIEANVHVDVVAWTDRRPFIGEQAALQGLLAHLQARRRRAVSADEPTGILTHHLILDRETEAFLDRLTAVSAAHSAVRWLSAADIFVPALVVPA